MCYEMINVFDLGLDIGVKFYYKVKLGGFFLIIWNLNLNYFFRIYFRIRLKGIMDMRFIK